MCNMHGRRFIVVDTMGVEIGHFVNYDLSTVGMSLYHDFFFGCDNHVWCTIIIVIPPKKPPQLTVLVGSLFLKGL